jgi:hypothetical protein
MRCDRCGQEMAGVKDSPSGRCRWRCLSCGNYNRPPLGVMPRHLWLEGRIEDLRGAIERHLDAWLWPKVEWVREMADRIEEVAKEGPQATAPFIPPPATPEEIGEVLKEYEAATSSDAEVNGLPSNLGRGIKDPTEGERYPLDAAVAVLKEVVRTGMLPDGRPVSNPLMFESTRKISFGLDGRELKARIFRNLSDPNDCGITCEDHTGDGPLWSNFAESTARVLSEAVSSRLHASAPSGPNSPGLQQPSTPSEPSDQDFDEWMALKTRVDAADCRPWVDHRTQQWCARDPRDGTVHFFGPSESDRDSAYRWADNILFRSHHEPHRETRP